MRHHFAGGRRPCGFTLLELLAALAVGSVLAALGWPLLTRQQATAAVVAASSRTLAALQAARAQALASGHAVTVCPTADTRRCGFGGTADGGSQWMAFENRDGGVDALREAGDVMLQIWRLPRRVQVGGTRGFATYQPSTQSAATLTFRFCHPRHPEISRSVIVSQTGRPRITRPARSSTAAPGRCP